VLDFVMMTTDPACPPSPLEHWTDEHVVTRVLQGEVLLFEVLMRRHNQRIYRAIRSILRDDSECEDVMQETYVRAFEHLAQFEGRAKFSTWLTRIAVNESIKRSIARGKLHSFEEDLDEDHQPMVATLPASEQSTPNPETTAARGELAALLEHSILALPPAYRTVLMLRDIEEMSTSETAEVLAITDSNVKVRLHRAHELLRSELMTRAGASGSQAFMFPATRCNRVVEAVFHRLNLSR
jgi:RNA polymerase sigma-70 factor (ECF subfamily)